MLQWFHLDKYLIGICQLQSSINLSSVLKLQDAKWCLLLCIYEKFCLNVLSCTTMLNKMLECAINRTASTIGMFWCFNLNHSFFNFFLSPSNFGFEDVLFEVPWLQCSIICMHLSENELEACDYYDQNKGAFCVVLFPPFNFTVHWRKVSFTFFALDLVR